jgi:multiple sugar transport system permease protein
MKAMERGILSRYDYRKKGNYAGFLVVVILLAAMTFSMLYPIVSTFLNGLKNVIEVNSFPPKFLPSQWVWDNFKIGWHYIDLPHFLGNTMKIFAGNMIVTVLVLGIAAFSLSRLNYPYRKGIYFFFLLTLFVPPSTYIVPNFVNLRDLGLLDTYWAFWLPAGASAFYLLLLKTFFDSLHAELFEAARMDGASEWRSFTQIALPLSVPIFATLAIFIFATAWNDWFWPSLVLGGDPKFPLATAIYRKVISSSVTGMKLNIKFAILSMVMLPPIVMFLVFQRFIIRGLHLGSVKG